jgi:phosphate transport system substrate-binding protein
MDKMKLSTELQVPNKKEISSAFQKAGITGCKFRKLLSLLPSYLGGERQDKGRLGHWKLTFGNYLVLGIWNLGFLFCLFSILFNVGCQRSRAGMTVAGSTSVEPFAELLAEEYMSMHSESHIYVQGGGSTAGVEAVITGAANIGMSSRDLTEAEKKLYTVAIAKDAIAIIVHISSPIDDLPLNKIREVFSGKIANWKALGGPDHPIHIVTREEGSGTRDSFQKFVMGKEDISLGALVQDSNGAVRQVISSDPNAIGYISLGLVNEQVKALRISGVDPNLTNVYNGRYTLVRPFLFIFSGKPAGEAKSFIDFVLSPQAQKLLLKEGLVPIIEKLG